MSRSSQNLSIIMIYFYVTTGTVVPSRIVRKSLETQKNNSGNDLSLKENWCQIQQCRAVSAELQHCSSWKEKKKKAENASAAAESLK